jgi:hypothetical protein
VGRPLPNRDHASEADYFLSSCQPGSTVLHKGMFGIALEVVQACLQATDCCCCSGGYRFRS